MKDNSKEFTVPSTIGDEKIFNPFMRVSWAFFTFLLNFGQFYPNKCFNTSQGKRRSKGIDKWE